MDPNTQKLVQDLAAGWTNFLSQQMSLDKDTFQLAQGTLGLQTADNSGLFLMEDAVPALSVVGYYDASTMKKRSDAYGNLLNALLSEANPQALRNALGNYYSEWITWKKTNAPQSGESYLAWFKRWEMQSDIDAGAGTRAESAVISTQNSALIKAQTNYYNLTQFQQQFSPAGQPQFSLYVYSGTTDGALKAINDGQSLNNINFDSARMESSVSHTFVEGSASGFYSIFSGGASGSFEQLNTKAANQRFTITGRLGSFATLSVAPGGWYGSGEVSRALNGKGDNTIWDSGASAGDWNSFFGQPNGSLARYISQLVLVSDYELTVTSYASYSQQDFQQIKTQASFGVWPFFSGSASATHTTDYNLNSNGTLSITHKLPKGSIQIWGANILSQS
jgi:hypothetical protein